MEETALTASFAQEDFPPLTRSQGLNLDPETNHTLRKSDVMVHGSLFPGAADHHFLLIPVTLQTQHGKP